MKSDDRFSKVYQLFVESPNDTVPKDELYNLFSHVGFTLTEEALEEIQKKCPNTGLTYNEYLAQCEVLEKAEISKEELQKYLKSLTSDDSGNIDANTLINTLSTGKYTLDEYELAEILQLINPDPNGKPLKMTNNLSKSKTVELINEIVPKVITSTSKKIYLDSQATKPLDPRILDAMLPYYISIFGNPHSRTHSFGWNAEKGVENARKQVADLIKANEKEIIFTSGATESNNLAIKGVVSFLKKDKKPVHIITTQIEHKCVLDTFRRLEEEGVKVTYLPVNKDGILDTKLLKDSITKNTCLVSVMSLNNEIGSIQPLKEIGRICRENNVLFHTDAAQAVGSIDIDVNEMNIDLLSLSGHKIYGPKGIGALYIRKKPRVRILPIFNGGGQERGLRSGTNAPSLIVGLGKAAEICSEEMKKDYLYIKKLSDKLKGVINKKVDNVVFNGNETNTYPGCLNISFPYVEGEGLMMNLKDIAVSSGSACTSSSLEPSYVLRALGKSDDLAHSSIRFGINKFTTDEEIDKVGKDTIHAVKKLRDMSPLYEMVNEGIDLDKINWSA